MSFFSSKFAGKKGTPIPQPTKAPVVRREARPVSNSQVSPKPTTQKPSSTRSSSTPQPPPAKAHRTHEINGRSQAKTSPSRIHKPVENDRTKIVRNRAPKKRKIQSPAPPAFGSDSEGSSSQSETDFLNISRKRARTETGSPEPDLKRRIRDVDAWGEPERDVGTGGSVVEGLIHGADLTRGAPDKFMPVFEVEDGRIAEVELQYPCPGQKESFQLVLSKEVDGYKPLEDISETITEILTHYLPSTVSQDHLDPSRGIPYRLARAVKDRSFSTYETVIAEFNSLIQHHLTPDTGTIAKQIDRDFTKIPMSTITRLLNQTYSRTVSPKVELLKKYENGTDFVYGELNYPFVSLILRQDAHLKSSQVFLDLGSGVGNVVLQAALETGCEAHGIEIMANPCKLAEAQASEFKARCRLWGLKPGQVSLSQGDFLQEPRVFSLLQRADVVLVNNQAFLPELNERIKSFLFLELKDGAKVISLKNFQQSGWQLNERNSNSVMGMFKVRKGEYYRNWVSWMDSGGDYFVAEKDSKIMQDFADKKARRGASAA